MSNNIRLRCKAGDLAIITDCVIPANNGKIVRVIERSYDLKDRPAWIVESENSPLVYPVDGVVRREMKCRVADFILTPITPRKPAKTRRARKTLEAA